MRIVVRAGGVLALFLSFSVYADSFIRIKCDDKDVGAQLFINGKLVGRCPADVLAPPGQVLLTAKKTVSNDYEQVFTQQLQVIDGVPQRIELVMGAPQLTAEAKKRNEIAEAASQQRAAEAGNVVAMGKLAAYYESGTGVPRDPVRAKQWRDRAEAASAQEQLRLAGEGNIQAMAGMAARYESGTGVSRDPGQAQAWRQRAEAALRERQQREELVAQQQAVAERAQLKQQRLASFSYAQNIRRVVDDKQLPGTSATTLLPYATSFDLTSIPTRISEIQEIQNEASLRPSTWGKPDSMMARATQQYQARTDKTETLLAAR